MCACACACLVDVKTSEKRKIASLFFRKKEDTKAFLLKATSLFCEERNEKTAYGSCVDGSGLNVHTFGNSKYKILK